MAKTSDDGYVISGTRFGGENSKNPAGFVIKIDSKQKLVFRKQFGSSEGREYAGQIFPTTDEGYVIFGRSEAENGRYMLFLNINSDGIVPGCSFFHQLSVQKVSSSGVRNRSVEIRSRKFALTPGSIDTTSSVYTTLSTTTCP